MVDVKSAEKPKARAGAFESPKFEMPKFELPKAEVPAAFREFAEKGVAQAKENYDKFKVAAEEATGLIEETFSTASKGSATYGQKVIEAARTNTNAAFDFFGQFLAVKSVSEAVELSSGFARTQLESLTAQSKDLAALAQQVANDAAEPLKVGVNKAFNRVA